MIVTEGTSKTRARPEVPVWASLGLRAAAAADLFASLARLLSPVFDVLIRLWLAAEGRVGMIQAIERGADSDKSSDTRSLISLRGISRVHDGGAIAALRNVDLQIAAGEGVARVHASRSRQSSPGTPLLALHLPAARTTRGGERRLRR